MDAMKMSSKYKTPDSNNTFRGLSALIQNFSVSREIARQYTLCAACAQQLNSVEELIPAIQ